MVEVVVCIADKIGGEALAYQGIRLFPGWRHLEEALIPADGVYATLAYLDGRGAPHPSATHIGPNVTFGEQDRKVECHLIDFEGDLYGRTVGVDVLSQLRASRKFSGLDDLLAQIKDDVALARLVCEGQLRAID